MRILRVILIGCLCCSFWSCRQPGSNQPTPDAAKQFLKLRGYEFDEASFHRAAAAGYVMAVHGFLAAGINPNARESSEGDTALTAAAGRGDLKTLEVLLQGGADVNTEVRGGWTPLLIALQQDRDQVVKTLLGQKNLNLQAQTPNGMNAVMIAVWRERGDLVPDLVQRGAKINHQDKAGDTALHGAVIRNNQDLLKTLLEKGALPDSRNKLGGTPLMWAASYGHEEAVRVLLQHGADPVVRDEKGITASMWAVKNKHTELAEVLAEAEAGR